MASENDSKPEVAAPPEAEAEIVYAGDAAFAAQPSTTADAAARPKSLPLFPGLIVFFVFVAAVLGAFLVWRLQDPQESTLKSGAAETEAPPPAGRAGPVEETVSEPVGAAAPITEEPPPPQAKIENSISDVKDAALSRDFGDSIDQERGLPPPPANDFGNATLQDAAKDARSIFASPAASAEPGGAVPNFEITPPEQNAASEKEPPLTDDLASALPQAPADALHAENQSTGSNVLGNDLAELKSMLDEERRVSQQQAEEIESLRQTLDAVVSAQPLHAEPNSDPGKIGANLLTPESASLTLALLSLNRRIASGRPYETELARVQRMTAQELDEIAALKIHAADGVPSMSSLQDSFPDHARKAISAAKRDAARGPVGAFLARASGLVSVRPARPQEGADAVAVISRAEARLGADDLGGAVSELTSLGGGPREAFAPWLARADARLDAMQAAALLEQSLLTPRP